MGSWTLNGRSLGHAAPAIIIAAGLALACTDTPTGTTPTYTVGAMISGLTGSGLVLRDNGKDDLAISGNGPVTFATPIASGAAYRVTVFAQPSSPAQGCVVTGGSGTVSHANVTTVGIACTTNTYSVGGTVSGLIGSGLVLRNNGGDDLPVFADGPVTFATLLTASADYSVTVLSQPMSPAQTCVITGGSGSVTDADVTTVAVACFLSGSASPLLVSSPVPDPSPSAPAVRTSRLSAAAVYVSLPPGTIPNGVSATIRNLHTGSSVTAAVVNGGFDPVALSAVVGDSLTIVVQRAGGGGPSFLSVVAGGTRPGVVRTDPPSHKRDVPLNGLIVMVFSEPIAPATLTVSTVQLKQGTTLVPGQLAFADPAHLRATFTPGALLTGATDYVLTITQGITDVNGQPLDSAFTVPFTTGTTLPAAGLVFASVSVGAFHSCGVTTSGAAYCWGTNQDGGLGDGTTANSTTPVAVAGGLTFAAVSAGWLYTCGVTTTGALYCWGGVPWSNSGEASPLPLAPGLTFASVSAGSSHMCGVTTTGAAYCWGIGGYGQLGSYRQGDVVLGGLTFAAVHAGDGYTTCGVTTSGAAYCWGSNTLGGLGTGSTTGPELCNGADVTTPNTYPCSHVPAAVAGGLTFVQVVDGINYACGVTSSGSAYCWGDNFFGQLGNGTTTGPDVCWRSNPCTASPVPVAGGLIFASVSAGPFHMCGLTTTGAGYCWGGPWLGDGSSTGSATPVAVAGGLTFAAVSVGGDMSGYSNTCGVTTAGVAYCWGDNNYGQLGDGTATNSPVPVKVAGQP